MNAILKSFLVAMVLSSATVLKAEDSDIFPFCLCKEVPDRHYNSYYQMWRDHRYYATLTGINRKTGATVWEKVFGRGFSFPSECTGEIESNPSCANRR